MPRTFDGDPAHRLVDPQLPRLADFGGLKPGVGVVYDLGSEQSLAGVTITTTLPGSTVEVRTGGAPDGALDAFPVAATTAR